ncbi:MAG: GyrI-like domain-containing protein [Pseudomonadota bacterium]
MKFTIVERQPVKVACLRYTGPLGEPLGRFWRGSVAPWLAEHGLVDCPRYGVTIDDPMTTPAQMCRYDACVELPAALTLPDANETTIAGGRYAVTHFKGTSAHIGEAWGRFMRSVLSDPAHRLDAQRHLHEHYPRGTYFDAKSGEFACELCLPLGN